MKTYFTREEIAERFGKYIETYFESQAETGRHYDVSRNYIWRIENNKVIPNKEILADLGFRKVTRFIKDKGE